MEKYLKDGLVPRKLRWDVPINDGLLGDEDIEEWYAFFTGKGREVMEFLIKRKQRKLKLLENQIKEIRDKLGPFYNTPEYTRLMGELHKNMQKKDIENKNVKRKKYLRDFEDYQNKQVFRWQSTLLVNEVANSQPQTMASGNGDTRILQPQGRQHQQQQYTKQPNKGHPPYRQEDKQPPRMPYYGQQGRSGNEGTYTRYPQYGPPPHQGNWGYGVPSHRGNGNRAHYEGDQYDRGYRSNPPNVEVDNIILMVIIDNMDTSKAPHTDNKEIMDTSKRRRIVVNIKHHQGNTHNGDIRQIQIWMRKGVGHITHQNHKG